MKSERKGKNDGESASVRRLCELVTIDLFRLPVLPTLVPLVNTLVLQESRLSTTALLCATLLNLLQVYQTCLSDSPSSLTGEG